MALLLGVETDASGESAPRDIMRSTGIRRPWMPRPLAGGATQFMRLAPTMAMAAALAGPILPGATVWMPRPLDSGVVVPQEKLSPLTIQVNQPQPPTGVSILLGMVPRAPNVDPLRPLALIAGQQPQPVGGVVQTYAPRDFVVVSPDRLSPPQVISGQQPLPVASFWAPQALRVANTDPLRPMVPQTGAQPVTGSRVTLVGAVLQAPERLSPVLVRSAASTPPGATVALLDRPRDQVVVSPDRLAQTLVITPAARLIDGQTRWIGAAKETPVPEPLCRARLQVVTPAREQAGALVVWTRGGIDGSTPVPPVDDGTYQGDAYIYDADGPTGGVAGGTILPNGGQSSPTGVIDGGTVLPGPNQDSPTGSVSGGAVQPNPNQDSPIGTISGGTVLPPETII